VQPISLVFVDVYGPALTHQLMDQIIESKGDPPRNHVHDFRFHAVNSHANLESHDRFFTEIGHQAVLAFQNPQIDFDYFFSHGDRKQSIPFLVKGSKVPQVEIGNQIAVQGEKRFSYVSIQQPQRTYGAEWLRLLGVSDIHIPLAAIATQRTDQMSQVPGGNGNIPDPPPPKVFQSDLNDREVS